jgi:hypothetical protein
VDRRCISDDVLRPLAHGHCGALRIAERLIPRLEAVTIAEVLTHEFGR